MATPLLSVVIPTHNRSKYAFYAIRSVLAIKDERLELIVSDTSPGTELNDMLSAEIPSILNDVRLKYLRPTQQLDMTGNHNYAIANASGAFVCLIGDDDTITNETILVAEWAMKNDIEVISPDVMANYTWPDFFSIHFGKGHAARLYLPKKLGGIRTESSLIALDTALKTAAQGTEGLPKIYHGIVQRSLIQTIIAKSGACFHGSSPDVSGALGLSAVSGKFLIIQYPITIPGASGGSNTGRSAENKHIGKLSDERQTSAFERQGWSLGVPRFFSVETVWAHAAIETVTRIIPSKVKLFNFARLFAICRVLHPSFAKEIELATDELASLPGNEQVVGESIQKEMRLFRRKRWMHILRRAMRPPTAAGGRRYIGGIGNIEIAKAEFEQYMAKRNWNWQSFIDSRFKS